MPLSMDLRERIVAARTAGQEGDVVAERFGVGIATVRRLDRRVREGRSLEPGVSSGRRPRVNEEGLAILTALVIEKPDRLIPELMAELEAQAGIAVSSSTMSRCLAKLGLTRKKRQSTLRSATRSE